MPFELVGRVGQRNDVLDGNLDAPTKRANLGEWDSSVQENASAATLPLSKLLWDALLLLHCKLWV